MFRIPYRWRPNKIWSNLCSMWWDLRTGVRNLWRWIPIVWFDYDFDWDPLARIMEAKLRWMAKDAETWIVCGNDKNRRDMIVCAEILARLRSGAHGWYSRNAKLRFPVEGCQWAEYARDHALADKKYLGVLIGKYLDHWWE